MLVFDNSQKKMVKRWGKMIEASLKYCILWRSFFEKSGSFIQNHWKWRPQCTWTDRQTWINPSWAQVLGASTYQVDGAERSCLSSKLMCTGFWECSSREEYKSSQGYIDHMTWVNHTWHCTCFNHPAGRPCAPIWGSQRFQTKDQKFCASFSLPFTHSPKHPIPL